MAGKPASKPAPARQTVVRDSRTGRFVEPKEAIKRPSTTEKETYKRNS